MSLATLPCTAADVPDATVTRLRVLSNQLDRALESGDPDLVSSRSASFVAAVARRRFPQAAYAEIDLVVPQEVGAARLLDADRRPVPGSLDYLEVDAPQGDVHDARLHEVAANITAETADVSGWANSHGARTHAIDFAEVDSRTHQPGSGGHLTESVNSHAAAVERVRRMSELAERERLSVAASAVKVIHPDATAVTLRPGPDGFRFDTAVLADGTSQPLPPSSDWSGFAYRLDASIDFDRTVDLDEMY